MADTTNEMNLPVISVPMMSTDAPATVPAPVVAYDDAQDATIAVGSPVSHHNASDVTVYANSINPISYNGEANGVAAFDIVFSVGIACGDGVSKTYQVVKRIGIDKCKIACEAESTTPVSIVENKSAALKEEAAATAKRFRRLAGLE